ncbi:MAG TPA: histidine triad nucleotide-binding protein [Gemmatimonadales bacterium]|nr:histidine triad nucleotide-binding protein [Gemmatimonadales bacterium]
MSECIFCRIVSGEIPATEVGRTEDAVAFRDLNPQAPVHVLIIPTRHAATAADLLAQDGGAARLAAVFELATRVADELGLADRGYRLVANTGAEGGQTVHHLHVHLLGGRQLTWPPG